MKIFNEIKHGCQQLEEAGLIPTQITVNMQGKDELLDAIGYASGKFVVLSITEDKIGTFNGLPVFLDPTLAHKFIIDCAEKTLEK